MCGTWFPDRALNLDSLFWGPRLLATGPPGPGTEPGLSVLGTQSLSHWTPQGRSLSQDTEYRSVCCAVGPCLSVTHHCSCCSYSLEWPCRLSTCNICLFIHDSAQKHFLEETQVQAQNAISPGKVPSKSDSRKILRVEWRWVGVTWTLVLDQCRLVSSQLCFLGLLDRKMIPFSINLLTRSIEITMWIHPAHGRSSTGMTASLFIPSF